MNSHSDKFQICGIVGWVCAAIVFCTFLCEQLLMMGFSNINVLNCVFWTQSKSNMNHWFAMAKGKETQYSFFAFCLLLEKFFSAFGEGIEIDLILRSKDVCHTGVFYLGN